VFAYHAPEVEPSSAKGHPTLAPIRHAGPWEFRPHRDGGTLCLFAGTKDRLDAFDAPVEAEPGLRFLPPRQEVTPAMLARPAAGRPDATTVALASGQELAILPAYLEPRRVLSGGRVGDPVTEYGRLAREVLGEISASETQQIALLDPRVIGVIGCAIAQTYRVTTAFLDWSGWISTADLEPLLNAVMSGPKAPPASAPSASSLAEAGSTASP